LLLAVVSDTHGHLPYTLDAVAMLDSLDVDEVIHCGDIGSAEIVEAFRAWPTHFVFGNVDIDEDELREAITRCRQTCHGRFGLLEREGRRIAWLHSDDQRLFRQTIESQEYDLVCYGHTHVPEQHFQGRTLVLNPGALYRATPHTLAVVRLPALEVSSVIVPR
jgi:putative phosphoesterase